MARAECSPGSAGRAPKHTHTAHTRHTHGIHTAHRHTSTAHTPPGKLQAPAAARKTLSYTGKYFRTVVLYLVFQKMLHAHRSIELKDWHWLFPSKPCGKFLPWSQGKTSARSCAWAPVHCRAAHFPLSSNFFHHLPTRGSSYIVKVQAFSWLFPISRLLGHYSTSKRLVTLNIKILIHCFRRLKFNPVTRVIFISHPTTDSAGRATVSCVRNRC